MNKRRGKEAMARMHFSDSSVVKNVVLAAFVAVGITNSLGQITQSGRLVIDTTKIANTTSVDARINACIGLGNNVVCDASSEPLQAPVMHTIAIPTGASGITLILGSLLGTSSSGVDVQMISIAGNNNDVYCAQGWGSYSSTASSPIPSLDASAFTGLSTSATAAVSITGNGNKFHDCYIQGSYFKHASKPFNSPPATPPLGDCIQIQGTGNTGTTVGGNDNEIRHNFLQYCGNRGVFAQDTYRTKIQDNYTLQSFGAGVEANAKSFSSAGGEISSNYIQDAELQFNDKSTNANAGNGDINIISSGPSGGSSGEGLLTGWLVHDNVVINSLPVCNSGDTSIPSTSDHGCSEGIQVTENPWDIHIFDNYVYNTGSEGITLCQYNCSASGNHVGNASLSCPKCGGIIQAVQSTTTGTAIGNTVVSGNTI